MRLGSHASEAHCPVRISSEGFDDGRQPDGARNMKINIAVSGAFHYRNYVKYIDEYEYLNKFYFSHRIGEGRKLGIQREKYLNFFPKEYMTQGHGRLIGETFSEVAYPIYAHLWTLSVLVAWTRADILHALAHGFVAPLIRRAKREGTKVVAEVVNTHPANQMEILAREADRWGLPARPNRLNRAQATIVEETQAADRILVPTETVKRSFAARGVDPAKIIKIPYAANTTRFRPRTETDSYSPFGRALRVICVGSIGLRKGQLYLLEAVRRLGKGAVEVTLVGAPSAEVASILGGYGAEFHHLERIANDRLRDLLVQHDLFVLPSLEEGLAVSICEAMACGLPIVATRESGAEELLTEGQEGFFVGAGSADAIAERLAYLDRRRDLLLTLGARAAEATRRRLNWRTYAARLVEAYGELAAA
jgi:glycosyltransferase involved in cell wall biosynthesis